VPRRDPVLSSENVQTIAQALDAIEANDREEFARLTEASTHPDGELVPLIGVGIEGSYRGPEGILRFFGDLLDAFEVRYLERDLRAVGDESVVLLCRLQLRGRESDIEIVQEMGTLYEFEDGLLRRGRVFRGHAETIAAAEALHA
jgi:hypothetical protein